MNQTQLLRESRLKRLLRTYEDAAKQFRVFRAVLPLATKNSEVSSQPDHPRSARSECAPE
jgi:hypothetical protein